MTLTIQQRLERLEEKRSNCKHKSSVIFDYGYMYGGGFGGHVVCENCLKVLLFNPDSRKNYTKNETNRSKKQD